MLSNDEVTLICFHLLMLFVCCLNDDDGCMLLFLKSWNHAVYVLLCDLLVSIVVQRS